ncbi:hypothetical protein CRG98_005626 [Punica granatum]|uniref:Uncharacterized protein n=1 Tax=Punica granatum TaxID=22663 RepID=A0A2I0KZY0_PUNGR|nr:hypothetical protein CRG98_005626 [Punica granatum]
MSLLPSTLQNDCMKLNEFPLTIIANLSIFLSAATSRERRNTKFSTETPILAKGRKESAAVSCSYPLGLGQGRERMAEGQAKVMALHNMKGDSRDWM